MRWPLALSAIPGTLPPQPCFFRLQSYRVTLFIFDRLRVDFSAKLNFVTGVRARRRVRKNIGSIYFDLLRLGSNRFYLVRVSSWMASDKFGLGDASQARQYFAAPSFGCSLPRILVPSPPLFRCPNDVSENCGA